MKIGLLHCLRSIVPTIYFNFHYLPFRQAIRLPILLYKPHLLKCKGVIRLEPDNHQIRTGMIKLGFRGCSLYPNSGITWDNRGGTIIFHGSCKIGNDTYMSFGPITTVEMGDGVINSAGIKIASYRGLKIGKGCWFGWGCLIMDSNFHPLYDMVKKEFKSASGPIEIGEYNWFGTGCKIMHSVTTPERCIFGMQTIVTRGCIKKSYCVMGGSPVRVIAENVMRDYNPNFEDIDYESGWKKKKCIK